MVSPYDMLPGDEVLGRLRPSPSSGCPRDRWRAEEDRAASAGNPLPTLACMGAGVDESTLGRWYRGIKLDFRYVSPVALSQDYPSVKHEPEVAAAELGRLSSLGEIHCFGEDCAPPDLRVRPSKLIATGGKVRVVGDWPNHEDGLDSALLNSPANFCGMEDFCITFVAPCVREGRRLPRLFRTVS